jgi:putative transposase
VRRQQRLARIRAIWTTAHGRYGSPKIAAQLRREGGRISGKTVAGLMHAAGIRGRVVRRYKATTSSQHDYPVAANVLARQFTATQPHAVWMADITYGTPSKLSGGIQPGSQEDRSPGGSR